MDQQPLMAAWMAGSVVSLLSSLFWLPLGFIGGILGITGASLMVCRCHHSISFALAVKVNTTPVISALHRRPCSLYGMASLRRTVLY